MGDYRSRWLQITRREDTDAVTLTADEVRKVLRAWQWHEAWYDLRPEQKQRHLPSTYKGMLNRKAGWKLAADAIIEHRLPRLRIPQDHNSATEHVQLVGDFAYSLVIWLCKFAKSITLYWKTPGYKKARAQSGTAVETLGWRYESQWRGGLVKRKSRA